MLTYLALFIAFWLGFLFCLICVWAARADREMENEVGHFQRIEKDTDAH